MDINTIRKKVGEVTKELPEKLYTRKEVKLILLEVIKKLEAVE